MISIDALELTLFYHAVDLIDRLRDIPSREALALRAEARLYDMTLSSFCVFQKFSRVTLLTVLTPPQTRD